MPHQVDFVSTYSSISSSTLSSSRLHVLTSRTAHSPLPLSDFCKHLSTCFSSGSFSSRPQTNVVHDTLLTFTSSSLTHSPESTLLSTINLPSPCEVLSILGGVSLHTYVCISLKSWSSAFHFLCLLPFIHYMHIH